MEGKKTSLGLYESTLHNFNCAKVEYKFESADHLLMYLLALFIKVEEQAEEESRLKPMDKPMENDTFKKEKCVKN